MKRSILFLFIISMIICVLLSGCGKNDIENKVNKAFEGLETSSKTGSTDVAQKPINPFDYLIISFKNISPYGTVVLEKASNIPTSQISYSVGKEQGLSNGDKIVVSASCTDSTYQLTETQKEYTVEGLSYYVKTLNDFTDNIKSEIEKNIREKYTAYTIKNWLNNQYYKYTLETMEFQGFYFLYAKNTSNVAHPTNRIYAVYKMTGTFNKAGKQEYYWYGYIEDVFATPDGSLAIDYDNMTDSGLTELLFDTHYFKGKKSLDEIHTLIATGNLDKYQYETSIPGKK